MKKFFQLIVKIFNKIKLYLHLTLVLFVIAALSGFILGYVNDLTYEPIQTVKAEKTKKGIKDIFENVADFTEVINKDTDYKNVNVYYEVLDANAQVIGYVLEVEAPNSYSEIRLLVGIDKDGKVVGQSYLTVLETPGLGTKVDPKKTSDDEVTAKFNAQFVGKTEVTVKGSDTISGATISSKAVINSVRLSLEYYQKHFKVE